MSQALRVWSMPPRSLCSQSMMIRISWHREQEKTFPSLMLPDAKRISSGERIRRGGCLPPLERKDEQQQPSRSHHLDILLGEP